MALDTTTGASTAESYATVAMVDAYHLARNNTAWASLTTAVKEAALRKATEYLDATYTDAWRGIRVDSVQVLDWPRAGIIVNGYSVDDDSIPTAIQRACAELALKASSADLLADLTRGVAEKTIGPLKTVYDKNDPQTKRYLFIHRLIAPYISGKSGANVRLERS